MKPKLTAASPRVANRVLRLLTLASLAAGAALGTGAEPSKPANDQDRITRYLAGLNNVEWIRDVEFGKGGGRPLKLHILRPKPLPQEPMPVLVWIHGGAWVTGNKDTGLYHLSFFAQRGYFCASIEYRLTGEARFPAQIEDCKCAIRFLRAKAKEYNLAPDRIGVWGTSAGGHLAALLGTSALVNELEGTGGWAEHSSQVQAACPCAAPTDFFQWNQGAFSAGEGLIGGPFDSNKEKAALASPVTHVHKAVPPFLIVHGERDSTVPVSQSELLYAALKRVGADVTLHVEPGAPHSVLGGGPHTQLQKKIDVFFERHLKPGKPVREMAAAGRDIRAEELAGSPIKTESFDRDPGWEAHNNRVVPKEYPTIVQDFGYTKTNFAGKAAGEMGGQVWRASEPAYYAGKIGPRTLGDRLSASGTFALTKTTPGGGIFFGFFRAEQPGAGGRPIGSLGMHVDTEHSGARLAVRLITGQNRSCGTFVTPFLPGKFRPTPIRNDGTRYTWKLDYDPQAAGGRGQFTFTIRSHGDKPEELDAKRLPTDLPETHRQEALRRFPNVTTFSVDLPEGYRQQATTFDHFGLMNMMKAGGRMTVYFDDLTYDGHSQDFAQDPNWDASRNRVTYQAADVGGAHNFGFSSTSYAGGKPGEVGGTFWRSGKYGYYADRVGPLTLDDRLEAGGKVVLQVGAPDADMFLGWFNSANKETPPIEAGHFLGVHVGGPTRVGHYFHPAFATATGTRGQAAAGPVLAPGKVHHWTLVYDPAAEGGHGAIRVTLDKETYTLTLKKGVKAQGARFDRFGVFTSTIGGQVVKLFLDDLKYTASKG
jgi:acetyl esterase/lipase